jgi:hypothetical protein
VVEESLRWLRCQSTTAGWPWSSYGRTWRERRANWRLPRGLWIPRRKTAGDEAELDVVRAVANARLSVSDALETATG